MQTSTTEIIGQTFQEISDIVTKTMGAKGQLAIISDEFSRPYLTDDGVTVARECMKQDDPFKKMVATSMIEAASNTEKTAFDGTTLTVLLTNEFYKAGQSLIKQGMHPQIASDKVKEQVDKALEFLNEETIKIDESNSKLVKDVANITTKIPAIGELVYDAYLHAGSQMNVIIEHDRKNPSSSIEHIDGMILDAGYFSETFKNLCNDEDRFVAENAKIILLSEGLITPVALNKFFASISDTSQPLVFILDKSFNPEALSNILNSLVENKLPFMMVFINESDAESLFLDIAAKTNGIIQSSALGTTDYIIDYAGTADKIIVEQNKTTIIASGNKDNIQKRIDSYNKELDDNKYTIGFVKQDQLTRRISNLDKGVTKIKLACSTITEFKTIRMKLDDAIGAVRCACRDGVVLGGGKTLYSISNKVEIIDKALRMPMRTIINNAGLELPSRDMLNKDKWAGLDVKRNSIVNLKNCGIIDSRTSIEQAIRNASSIACQYLKAYILINGIKK